MVVVENKGFVTVLMAVYNTAFETVKRAIDSVLNQTHPFFELIVIDDGSDIDCLEKLVSYTLLHQNKISYLQHENMGQSKSINRGIHISKGNYITILDADDEYKENHLESCLKQMDKYDLISSTTSTIVNSDLDYYVSDKNDSSLLIHVDECILFATLFGKREVFEKVKFEDRYAADFYFYELAKSSFKVGKVDLRTYIYYRNNPNSITALLKDKVSKNQS